MDIVNNPCKHTCDIREIVQNLGMFDYCLTNFIRDQLTEVLLTGPVSAHAEIAVETDQRDVVPEVVLLFL